MSARYSSRRRKLLGLLAGAGATALGVVTLRAAGAQTLREIDLVAQRFQFVPDVIALKRGEPVLLRVRSLDFVHGFSVPDLNLRSDLLPGLVTQIRLTPEELGRLDFLCDNFCGDGHERMHGWFDVTA